MNIAEAKQINLVAFLALLGHKPVKTQNGKCWYLSPLRSEYTPSFKVNTDTNQWYDFGIAEGGDIISFGKAYYRTDDISIVLKNIAESAPAAERVTNKHINKGSRSQIKSEMRKVEFIDLSNESLLSYLMSRKIDINVAIQYCREIHYDHLYNHYYGIAFENISGGYEIRNPFFKGCRGKKDISIIYNEAMTDDHKSCCVFEGFMDFLSYMTLVAVHKKSDKPVTPSDYIVLNSVSTLKRAVDFLASYDEVHCYLDNDHAGCMATQYLEAMLHEKIHNESHRYQGYKDVNDFLRNKRDFTIAAKDLN
jgi:hypothetical protein